MAKLYHKDLVVLNNFSRQIVDKARLKYHELKWPILAVYDNYTWGRLEEFLLLSTYWLNKFTSWSAILLLQAELARCRSRINDCEEIFLSHPAPSLV